MYLEGIGFRGSGRVLDISYGTVFQWIKKAGKAASPIPKTEYVPVMDLDEMHTYVGKKKLPMPV
jgi:transposase-like protein